METGLRRRLDGLLGKLDVGNGTSAASALADALAIDLRLHGAGDGVQRLLALSDEQLLDLAVDVIWVLEKKHAEFELPLGSKVVATDPGGICVDGEDWVLDADHPGLHPLETVPRSAEGRNLELLHAEIGRLTRKLACRHLGLPTTFAIADDIVRHELRFPPHDAVGGAMLQRSAFETGAPCFRSALPAQIKAFAKVIVDDMRRMWTDRAAIADRVKTVRRVAIENGHPIHAVAVGMGPADLPGPVALYTDYKALDDALRSGLVLEYVPGGRFEEEPRVRSGHRDWREGERNALAVLGADGRIDDIARGIVSGAPEGAAAVLKRLSTDLETLVAIPIGTKTLYATLFWKDGTIGAEVSVPGKLDIAGSNVEVKCAQLPETVVVACAGLRLNQVLELPFPCDATVAEVENSHGFARIKFSAATWLVDTGSGRMWTEAAE